MTCNKTDYEKTSCFKVTFFRLLECLAEKLKHIVFCHKTCFKFFDRPGLEWVLKYCIKSVTLPFLFSCPLLLVLLREPFMAFALFVGHVQYLKLAMFIT